MRQIAEFVAVLACSLFTGAAVYVSLVEHPARMECGVEIAAAEFPPSYHRASVMQAILAAVGLLSSVGAWLSGATFWWGHCGKRGGFRHPIHADCDPATNKQLVNPALDRVGPNGTATRTLGRIARREKRPQRSSALAIAVSSNFREVLIRCNADGLTTAQGESCRISRKRPDQDSRPAAGRALGSWHLPQSSTEHRYVVSASFQPDRCGFANNGQQNFLATTI